MAAAAAAARASRARLARAIAARAFSSSPMPETMSYLRDLRSGNEVFLVGTAHISRKSADEVRAVIRSVKPDTVFLELCEQRAEALRSSMRRGPEDGVPEPLRQLLASLGCDLARNRNASSSTTDTTRSSLTTSPRSSLPFLPLLLLSAPGSLGEKLLGEGLRAMYQFLRGYHGLDPGLEFKVGLEEADRVGARLVLGDRAQRDTVRALSEALDLADVFRLLTRGAASNEFAGVDPELKRALASMDWSDPESAVELLKTRRATRAMAAQMRASFPRVAAAMLDQRDDVMTQNLLRRCSGRTVAVVGMAHMDGIEERWRDAFEGAGNAVSRVAGGE
jgi:pheromone shutdown protein TraB